MVVIKGAWHRWNALKTDRLLRHQGLGGFYDGWRWFFCVTIVAPVAVTIAVLIIIAE